MASSLCMTAGIASKAIGRVAVAPRSQHTLARRVVVRATEEPVTEEFDTEAYFKELQSKWDAVEDKTSVFVYGAGAVTLLWLSSTLVGAINHVPVLPKFMELVGLGYTAWFVYRYLLFKDSRKELITDVEELKKKISGDEKL